MCCKYCVFIDFQQYFVIVRDSNYYVDWDTSYISVCKGSSTLNAYILFYPDFMNGFPFTINTLILPIFPNLPICLPSIIWLCAKFNTSKLQNWRILSNLDMAL